jgi:sulfite reductase (ferredoxin)
MADNVIISKAAESDIKELQDKIGEFLTGQTNDEKFRAFRLVRGVYGQRQQGVQMIRIKLPFGKVSPEQLIRIADLSDKYGSSNLHATTRQDIQIHYVKLANAPKVWRELEEKGVTLREACGNTVRNITASATAGIDPKEPFDVSPYSYAMFKYFLRNPICQEMGRKFKIAFSSGDDDTAYTFIHDLGFIPKIKDGVKGFKVMLAGGLGAQPFHAFVGHEFLPEDQMIPYTEAVIRVFDRYGERTRRNKARLKYLLADIGLEEFVKLVELEHKALKTKTFTVDVSDMEASSIPTTLSLPTVAPVDAAQYDAWFKTNVFEQKQAGYFGVYVKVTIGDLKSERARNFANVVAKYCSDDIRVTVNQGYLLKFVPKEHLVHLFNELHALQLADPGFDSTADVVACPGTDTCNLGIASSMGLAEELEHVMKAEYADIIYNNDIKIKISGCMNACGQHTIANIGFHGMSMKHGEMVLPGMQVLLGGGIKGDGEGSIAEKVIKLPAKRVPQALRSLLDDYEANAQDGEYFNNYYTRQTKNYFYQLLKPLGVITELTQDLLVDWGNSENYETAVGVGECAGVLVDMVQILIDEQQARLDRANEAIAEGNYADAIYHCYNTFINAAKALLLSKDIQCNTQHGIMNDFDTNFVESQEVVLKEGGFRATVLLINQNEPTEEFAKMYKAEAELFLSNIVAIRSKQVQNA